MKALSMPNLQNYTGRSYSTSTVRELMVFCRSKGLHYIPHALFALLYLNAAKGGSSLVHFHQLVVFEV